MPSRASNAALTVVSRADRDIEISLGRDGQTVAIWEAFVGIRRGRVKAHSIVVPAKAGIHNHRQRLLKEDVRHGGMTVGPRSMHPCFRRGRRNSSYAVFALSPCKNPVRSSVT